MPSTALPESSPLAGSKVTPAGRGSPDKDRAGAGDPVAVTEKSVALRVVKVVALTLLMAGASSTVRVNVWVGSVPTPLSAVKLRS